MTLLRALVAALLVAAQSVLADPINDAFASWMRAHDVSHGALAVIRGGNVTGFEHGWSPRAAVDLASLSKAITAICAAEVEQQTNLDWGSSPRGMNVSLRSLLYHTSGIAPDLTQGLAGLLTFRLTMSDAMVAKRAKIRERQLGRPGVFFYNNENYALVAELIAQEGPVEDVCRDKVLTPAGVTGEASKRFGHAISWAGWSMSVVDYAVMHNHWFNGKRSAPHGKLLRNDGQTFVYYGLGTFARHSGDDVLFWHTGALCLPNYKVNTLVLTRVDVGTVVAAFDACADAQIFQALFDRIEAFLR